MAQYQIAFSCGHTDTKQLFGKETDRQRYIAWAQADGVCPACRADDKAAALVEYEAEQGLPELTGSDKQIAWARDIRAAKIAGIIAHIDTLRARVPADKAEMFEGLAAERMVALAGQSAAKWWIDARELQGDALIVHAAK